MSEKSKASLQKENVELRKHNKALEETVTILTKEVTRLQEVGHSPVDSDLSPEEQILVKQIEYFKGLALNGPLTLDDTRAVDILLKNKRILDDKKPKKNEDEVPEGTTDADLLRIVSNGETPVKENKKTKRRKSKS